MAMETSANVTLAELPDDIFELILLKLPSNSLIRFKSVSKAWRDLFSSARFVYKLYRKISSAKFKGCRSSSTFIVPRYTSKPYDKYFTMFSMSHADGKVITNPQDTFRLPYFVCERQLYLAGATLVYPAGFGIYCVFDFHLKKLALWNPTTRELLPIPWPSWGFDRDGLPAYCKFRRGFAHVDYEDGVFSYKVGLMRNHHDEVKRVITLTMWLYSSVSNSWKVLNDCRRLINVGEDYPTDQWHLYGTNLNNKFHILTWFCKEDPHIVTFDMKSEEFGRIEVPSFLQHELQHYVADHVLTNFDGKSLCLLCDPGGERMHAEAWVQSEDGKTWTKKASTSSHADGVLGISDIVGGMFFEGMDHAGQGLLFSRYGSTEFETLLTIEPHEWQRKLIVEYEESIVPLNGFPDQRITR